jgi:S1-C subfamily serine protease
VTVAAVRSGSPAAKAGLKAATHQVTADGQTALLGGDSITALDGRPIRSAQALATAVAARRPGQRVRLTVVRGSATRTVSLTLGTAP